MQEEQSFLYTKKVVEGFSGLLRCDELVDKRLSDSLQQGAINFRRMFVLLILLHECDERIAVGTLALRFAVSMQHDLRELLQRFFGTGEFDHTQIQFGDHTV